MKAIMSPIKIRLVNVILLVGAIFISSQAMAVDFNCQIPQVGEIYIDTQTGSVTKSAEETLTVEIATENSHYRFEFKGKKNQFKALINRASGQIILDDACTPNCWGGSMFGTCTPIKAKF